MFALAGVMALAGCYEQIPSRGAGQATTFETPRIMMVFGQSFWIFARGNTYSVKGLDTGDASAIAVEASSSTKPQFSNVSVPNEGDALVAVVVWARDAQKLDCNGDDFELSEYKNDETAKSQTWTFTGKCT